MILASNATCSYVLFLGLALTLLVSYTLASFHDFGIPSSNAIVEVMAFNVANLTIVNGTHRNFAPVLPGRESVTAPVHAFFIEHKSRNQRLMFDLGLRNDPLNFPPSVSAFFADGIFSTGPFKDITELLQGGGIPLESIDAVIWRCEICTYSLPLTFHGSQSFTCRSHR